METQDKLLYENLKKGIPKKDEILQLDQFINRYASDDQYDGQIYVEIFNLLVTSRICKINEK
jgi:hypothetical protein